jgi:hypothetical protein
LCLAIGRGTVNLIVFASAEAFQQESKSARGLSAMKLVGRWQVVACSLREEESHYLLSSIVRFPARNGIEISEERR